MIKNKTYYVYTHTRQDNNELFYVGIGTKNEKGKYRCKKYVRAYFKSKSKRSEFWYNIFEKSGKQILIDIVFESSNKKEVEQKEIFLIKKYGRRDLKKGSLVNLTDGGEGLKGVKWTTHQQKERSEKYSGENNPFYGKKHTDATIEEMLQERKGTNKGENNPFFNRKHTEMSKNKIAVKIKENWHEGKMQLPPVHKGGNNFFAQKIECINHNTGEKYIVEGNIKEFCTQNKLSYNYCKKYRNEGRINIEKHSRMTTNTLNTIGWEFKDLNN